jgi:hypothetical protein
MTPPRSLARTLTLTSCVVLLCGYGECTQTLPGSGSGDGGSDPFAAGDFGGGDDGGAGTGGGSGSDGGGDDGGGDDGTGSDGTGSDGTTGDDGDGPTDGTGGGAGCTGVGVCVQSFPFTAEANSLDSDRDEWNSYPGCGGQAESGPETIYEVVVPEAGFLSVHVSDGTGVDIDPHLLTSLDPEACIARDDHDFGVLVQAGTYYVVADTYAGEFNGGDYRIDIGLLVPSAGSCATQTGTLSRLYGRSALAMPATGPVVREAHLVTTDEGYGAGWPGSITSGIGAHYDLSQGTSGLVMRRTQSWAPQESSQFGQGSTGAKLPVEDEAWYVNMLWANRPAPGTRMIVQANGRAVVASAGYETGPFAADHIAGVTEEVHFYLGTGHLSTMTVGFAVDQALPLGPIDCE